jgi:hypothetical protein
VHPFKIKKEYHSVHVIRTSAVLVNLLLDGWANTMYVQESRSFREIEEKKKVVEGRSIEMLIFLIFASFRN